MADKRNSSDTSLEEKYKLVADTIRAYPLQLRQAWDEIQSSHIPDSYKDIDNIVFCGMGGSALGARSIWTPQVGGRQLGRGPADRPA